MPTEQAPAEHPDNAATIGEVAPRAQGATSPREIWFESDGTPLFAMAMGEGAPVVFIHGGLADHRAQLRYLAPLAATHRLITPDLRASGRSHYAGELSWDRLADDVAALLSFLHIETAVVGGVSMGSAVALRFALRHPRRLRALILMSPLYPGEHRPMAEASSTAMRVMAEAGARTIEGGMDVLSPLFDALPLPVRERALAMLRSFEPTSVAATTRFLATNAQPMRSARELAAIAAPVMVLPGIDPEHPADVGELYVQHLRHAVVVEQTAVNLLERVASFCTDAFATPAPSPAPPRSA